MSSENSSEGLRIGNSGYVTTLAEMTGASEPALRLLLSILAGYPIAAAHIAFVRNLSPLIQHVFFSICGFILCILNYGFDCYHSVVAVWVTYLLVRLLSDSPRQLLFINFMFHMSYLVIGYIFTESNDYDIIWTMPHCVLVLRMIGFGFDIADGRKPEDLLSKDQKNTALSQVPSLIELAAYAFFPASFLVGPQFPFRRYQQFIQGEFQKYTGSVRAGIIRGGVGVIYLLIRQFGAMMMPDSYFLTDAFRNQSMLRKLIEIGIWGKISLYKYISCWLLVEGALMCTGFTYSGKTAHGKDDWSGCSNVKLVLLETGSKMTHYVQSFNLNTNNWVAQYIYKRLKFFNNRMISYVLTLAFLAVWHGLHSGYYMAFFMEFSIITVEKQFEGFYNNAVLPRFGNIIKNSKAYKVIAFAFFKSYNVIYMGWCVTPFIMLSYDRWIYVFASLNYFGFVILVVWMLFYNIWRFCSTSNSKTENTKK